MPRSRGGALWRFALAALVVVLFTATTTAVAGLLQFKQIAKDLSFTPALPNARITVAEAGAPQTLLLIGSDRRAGTALKTANTDTMMLVRLDATSSTINVLSIPRDLKVLLPQGGVRAPGKLNAAYSLGGANLLVKTLGEQVFPSLHVNHIIDVNFGGFSSLVNAIGCVYADVDRRYFHVSAPDAADNYSSINIQPGYQKLCGDDALAFVRFRHLDTDIVRNARQQDFLRWAKSQFSTSTLLGQKDRLLSIFGHHTQTDSDLHSITGLINLFNLAAFSAGHTVKQIPFPAQLHICPPDCYVYADPRAEQAVFQRFMTATLPAAPRPAPAAPASPGRRPPPSAPAPPLLADLADGRGQAHALGPIAMPVYVPTQIAAGSQYCAAGTCSQGPVQDSYPRKYAIREPGGARHSAYRMTLELNPVLGQYYGVQGTTWQNPPILAGPSETRVVKGKTLLLYRNGTKVIMVAWHTRDGVYWISNTLTDDLSGAQIVAIAASLTRA